MLAPAERIGYIKFGSRVDVIYGPEWQTSIKVGDRVSAGTSILAKRAASRRRSELQGSNSGAANAGETSTPSGLRFADAVHQRQYLPGICCACCRRFDGAMQVSAGDYGPNQHFTTAAKALGFRRVFRWAGWAHCAHDEHDQRFRPRAGFAWRT